MEQRNLTPAKRHVETAAAILMAATTLATAWCSFESGKWNGLSSAAAAKANELQRTVALLEVRAAQAGTIQVSMFMQLLAARQNGQQELVEFYTTRFPPEAKKAYDAWMAQDPFHNPAADPHPFVPSLYQPRTAQQSVDASTGAAQNIQDAERKGGISSQYTATTVLLAAVLFFVGTSTKFASTRLRQFSFGFGVVAFLLATLRIVTLPVVF